MIITLCNRMFCCIFDGDHSIMKSGWNPTNPFKAFFRVYLVTIFKNLVQTCVFCIHISHTLFLVRNTGSNSTKISFLHIGQNIFISLLKISQNHSGSGSISVWMWNWWLLNSKILDQELAHSKYIFFNPLKNDSPSKIGCNFRK